MQYDTLITTAIPLGRMSALSQGKIIIEGQETNGNRDLFLLQHRKLINLTDDRTDDRKPIALSDTSFVFTRYLHHHPVTSLYDITRRKSTSLFYDLDDYWPETVDHLNGQLYLSQYKSYNRKKWVRIPLDTVLHDTSDKPIPAPDMRYAGWQSDHSLHLPDTLIDNLQAKPVRFPQFSLTHAFSVALPVYDARDGWGLFGLSSWFEVMQRQMLVTSFILYPEKIEHSFFILNHVIKCCNLDFTSILYQGPVFFTFEQGSHVKLIRRYAGIITAKPVYLSGNPRFMLNPSFACAWQNYNARNALPENSSKTSYGILRAGTSLHYHKPTKLYPFLAKRQVYLSGYLHKAIDFTIYSSDLILGTNMVSELIGIKTNLSWLKKSGSIPPLQILGIDRFYQTNIPRDFGYTKTVRAIREDIAGNEMVWSSSELICVWPGRTPLRLLFIPLNNLAFSLFYDHAFIRTALTDHTVFGYGLESTFGTMHFRYGLGYARGRYSDGSYSDEVYVRFALTIPGLSHMREDYGSDITESGLKD
jgi:hypothetical protein